MFKENDSKYIKRLIGRNEVVLFLGSGFSRDAENQLSEKFPTGYVLGEKIWKFLGYNGEYDKTPLPEMYQAFCSAGIKKQQKIDFLNNNLLSGNVPELYNSICIPYWYKIYTLNIDDVLNKVYRRNKKSIQDVIFPRDEYVDRDITLDSTNVIYLHGKLPCEPNDIVFSTKQYAKAQLSHQPLYGQFVYDYATKPTIFIGTDLNEPIFERYIEAREGRDGYAERRPKSFLISPSISPVKADNLKSQYNVHHIEGTTEAFLEWIKSIAGELPSKESILRDTFPNLLSIMQYADLTQTSTKSVNEFAKSFNRVPTELKISNNRSGYLMGASPTWDDMYRELDVPRTITKSLFDYVEERINVNTPNSKINVINLIGTAGSGKSTIAKRLSLQLSQNGRTVFLTYSDFIPRTDFVFDVISAIKERVVIVFDNAKNVLPQIMSIIKECNKLEKPPIFIISIRSNHYDRLNYYIDPELVEKVDFKIPDLDDKEIQDLIEKLDKNNLLGVLQGKTSYDRFREFKYKAKKQILIAMREATKGMSFDEIIKDEFDQIKSTEAQTLCLCVAINTELGYTNSVQDFVGFSKVSHSEALNFLDTILAGTIIWVGNNNDRFILRHRILADFLIKYCADIDMLKEAYIRVLSILAPELKRNSGPSRKFNLYKSLINHQTLYSRFKNDIECARNVYDSVSSFFNNDSQYWLQYGSLEVEGNGGNLSLAENYLDQAESINPNNPHIKNAKCNLYYKQSSFTNDPYYALEYKKKADELAKEQLLQVGKEDPHIHHIYCRGNYYYITKWVTVKSEKATKLKELRQIIENSIKKHPRDKKLEVAQQAIVRAYLQIGVSDDSLTDPEIIE
jgi:ABC-type cobalamin/Fe3+-siderophores transport system ATPase subunit